jgi:hypothetical protein
MNTMTIREQQKHKTQERQSAGGLHELHQLQGLHRLHEGTGRAVWRFLV